MRLLLLAVLLCLSAFAQDKDIIRTRDKYRDPERIYAKPVDLLARAGKMKTAVSMMPVAILEAGKPVSVVAFVVSPETVTSQGGLLQYVAKENLSIDERRRAGNIGDGKVYFQPFAEAILLVGNARLKLLPADKEGGFSGAGDYRSEAIVLVPVEWFYKVADSKEWTILIGDVIVGIGDPDLTKDSKRVEKWAERVQPRLQAFAEAIRKINAERAK